MRRLLALILFAALIVVVEPVATGSNAALAQSNNDDYTPLNSRIPRSRQFPTMPRFVPPSEVSEVTRRRSLGMVDHFANCIWDRSNEDGLDLLARTDFGFRNFEQIGISNNEIGDYYPVRTCLRRVASRNNTGVQLSYNAESMRRWYIQAAYLDMYEDGATWVQPGYVVGEREYPLSAGNPMIHSAMMLADCVVAQDPHGADLFYRTEPQSEEESAALRALVPAISPCVPQGQEFTLDPFAMRVWLGEGLWHASQTLAPPPAGAELEGED
ncbi:hypothetical protein OZN62_02475 [Aurantiacibacter sp. MUD11]|uniref:hypothetical protein n=1 Tax=Aurantiacibacter sp. MUD11 TaxID=3003265 RepID=UPI0022AA45A2|nr:hypothetical protein [Aurantiacibacter sp. MUD11]WAT18466.1 hypothetical protein OZN62_02475 [Aurantiacibacter sp. MUD11]